MKKFFNVILNKFSTIYKNTHSLLQAFGIGWLFLFILVLCICIINNYDIIVNKLVPVTTKILIPIGNIISNHSSIALAIIILIIWVNKLILHKKSSLNPYIVIVSVTFITLFFKTPSHNFINLFHTLNCKWILIVSFFPLLYKEAINLKRIWFIYKSQKSSNKNTGFVRMTNDEELIDCGWDDYSNMLIERLKNTSLSEENFAIGISGCWGSGKSTFLKTLKRHMGSDFINIEFEAWQSNTPQSLIRDFFNQLKIGLEFYGFEVDISKYAALIDGTGISNYIKTIDKFLSKNISVEKEKNLIEKRLHVLKKPVVIFIDDADRMERIELMELFRLIRVTANFKNVIFIVAFDKKYIVTQIEKHGIKNGEEYLKKIFPLEISLPGNNMENIPDLIMQEISRQAFPKDFKDEILQTLRASRGDDYHHFITSIIKTYRDVKNFINSLTVAWDLIVARNLIKEIYFPDLFWIELIRMFYFDIYEILRNNPNNILDKTSTGSGNGWLYTYQKSTAISNKNSSQFEIEKNQLKNNLDNELESILFFLFSSANSSQASIRRYNNYRKYFSYHLPNNILSNHDFRALLLTDNKQTVLSQLKNICSQGKAYSLYNHLMLFNLSKCREKHLDLVINYITVLMHFINLKPGFLFDDTIRDIFNKNNLDLNISSEIQSIIEECLIDDQCEHIVWNKVLASLHSVKIFDTTDNSEIISYASILSDDIIISLSNKNCKKFLESQVTLPAIEDITSGNTLINKFVRDACIIVNEVPDESITNRTNIILKSLIDFYSRHKGTNNKESFLRPFEIDYDHYYPEFELDILEQKELLFGTEKEFNQFVKKCFI